MSDKYKDILKKMVQAAGQELIDKADAFVGDGDLTTDFEIELTFDIRDSIPEIIVRHSYVDQKAYEAYMKKE